MGLMDIGPVGRRALGDFMSLATRHAAEHGLAFDHEGEQELEQLIAVGVAELEKQGLISDRASLLRTEGRLLMLVGEMLADGVAEDAGSLDARFVQPVLGRFCPGFWPFC